MWYIFPGGLLISHLYYEESLEPASSDCFIIIAQNFMKVIVLVLTAAAAAAMDHQGCSSRYVNYVCTTAAHCFERISFSGDQIKVCKKNFASC